MSDHHDPQLEIASVGAVVAARVGTNIREVRTKLGMTQAQLAAPEFSISYISAIERGKIRPSLKALAVLAHRLGVPLAFLMDGSPAKVAEARAAGYSPADSKPDTRVDVDLLQAAVLVQQGKYEQATGLLAPMQPERLAVEQVYRLYRLRGEIDLGENQFQEAVVDLRQAVTQAEGINDGEYIERARNLLGKAYYSLYNYTLAVENHLRCHAAIESGHITDPLFALDVFSNLASDYFRLGELDKAVGYYHRALDRFEGLGRDSKRYAEMYMEISQRYKSAGKLSLAREYAMRSLSVYEMRDVMHLAGLTHQRLGKALEKQDRLDEAERAYQQAIAIETDLGAEAVAAQCSTSLAELLLKRGDVQGAQMQASVALAIAERVHDETTEGQALMALAQIRNVAGDYAGADQACEQALELLDRSQAHEFAASAYFRYANQLEARGEVQRSLNAVKKAYEHQRLQPASSKVFEALYT
jgi:tetratricopeptide (TPR) repeat protein